MGPGRNILARTNDCIQEVGVGSGQRLHTAIGFSSASRLKTKIGRDSLVDELKLQLPACRLKTKIE